ncbi:long-chain fatty acid--CoA ligase [Kribbella sandramycini]|uniref:Acyl-CoA synthetase n=1 Tax=Kribbella sandramycini TaxID=60450 RepID=A0A7Y4KV94_9ACTN|nr:long-chain fatty acid--CoA ligase [Kribbella sandramycini]MBB6568053.1 long-chain acyl-CoA synthetase [Kribbella sandramycini]NOL39353.1 long-chain fatty acid--CoA ligase [Kribbella sandramycini]
MKPVTDSGQSELLSGRKDTMARMFLDRVAATPQREAFRFPSGETWKSVTWAETDTLGRRRAAGLIALGVEPQQRVGIACSTRIEWVECFLAGILAAAATTTIYPTTMASDVAFIVADADVQVVFAENEEQVAKLRDHKADIPSVRKVVLIDGTPSAEDGDWVIALADLDALGDEHLAAVDERIAQVTPTDLCTLIYTSGTTGRPKGVRLPHSVWTYEGAAVEETGVLTPDDLQFLWLPLSHVFGQVLLAVQFQIGFATAIDGRIDKIVENAAIVQPTFMAAAPRIFEKAHARIKTMVAGDGGVKEKLFHWAFGVGARVSALRQQGNEPSGLLAVQFGLADKIVLSKIRARFGGRIRFFVSGSAALDKQLAEWFHAAGLLILEGYGLSETAAGSTLNRPSSYRLGSVGLPFAGTEIKIAEDGEILIKGDGVMSGYHNQPEQTAEVLSDGWLHTGDIGHLEDGYVYITDRKKDLFKTSGGKYVAPQNIEGRFKTLCPYASQFIVHGNQRNFVTALVTLDPDAITTWATANGLAGQPYADIVTSDAARAMVQSYVDDLNSGLNRWETIKKFTILDRDLTVESGEMTPSLKLKRKYVETEYAEVLNKMYDQ